MRGVVVACAVGLMGAGAGDASAQDVGAAYITGEDDFSLYSIELASGALTRIGAEGALGRRVFGLAFAPDGTLYGLAQENLVTIDLGTGATSVIGPHDIGFELFAADLAFSPGGELYGVVRGQVFTFDLGDGSRTVLNADNDLTLQGGLVFEGDRLFSTDAFSGLDALYELDPADGSVIERVGDLGQPGTYSSQGLDRFDGLTYMIDSTRTWNLLDLDTGDVSLVARLDVRSEALAIFVPTPGALALFGVAGVCVRGRRRA